MDCLDGVLEAPPNKLKVPVPFTGAFSAGLMGCEGALVAGLGAGDPPKNPPKAGGGDFFSTTGVGAGSTLTAGGDEKMEKVPVPLVAAGLLTGAGGGVLGAALGDAPPNNERVGAGLRTGATGAGLGATGALGDAGALPKRLNGCGLGLLTSCTGSGVFSTLATGSAETLPPKKEFKASVIAFGAISISVEGGTFGASTLGGATGFLAAGCWNKANGDADSFFFSSLTTGAGASFTGSGSDMVEVNK